MLHGERYIVLGKHRVGDPWDHGTGHNLFDECYRSNRWIFVRFDVKTKIDLFETSMKERGNAENSGVLEEKCKQADEDVTVMRIDRGAWWDVRFQHSTIHAVICE
jgi:hypothetical protein